MILPSLASVTRGPPVPLMLKFCFHYVPNSLSLKDTVNGTIFKAQRGCDTLERSSATQAASARADSPAGFTSREAQRPNPGQPRLSLPAPYQRF